MVCVCGVVLEDSVCVFRCCGEMVANGVYMGY